MVTIKTFDLQNVTLHYKWNKDGEKHYFGSDTSPDIESFNEFLRHIKSVLDERNKTSDLFEIYLSDTDKLIGIVNLHSIDYRNCCCYVNCKIGDQNYSDAKYAIAALRKTLAYCFNELDMHKVCTTALDLNSAWIEEVQNLGFVQEGILRKQVLTKEHFCDKIVFGLLAEEYQQAQKSSNLRAVNS